MKRFLLLVLLLGWVVLAGEIAMARLLAPTWGSGTVVWSFVIAVVLLALSLGYWLGGRVGDRFPRPSALALWMLPGIILLLLQPLLGELLLRPDRPGEFALFVLLGSLSFFFLGAATPWILRLLEESDGHSGERAGKLFAFSTIGSFIGTLSSALVLLPLLGTSKTFFLLGAIALLSLALLLPRLLLLLPLPLALFFLWSPGTSEGNVLWEGESAEQHLRVREAGGVRLLELDDGSDVQSIYRPGETFSGDLWDAPLYLWGSTLSRPSDLLVLGNGAGTTARAWREWYRKPVLGVELDPQITELGRRFFGLREDSLLRVRHGDARRVMRKETGLWGTVFLDTYDSSHIPFHLLTEEFFLELREKVAPRGVVVLNLQPRRDLLETIGRTSRSAFPGGALWKYSSGNYLVLLSVEKPESQGILRSLPLLPPELRGEARRAASEIEPLLRRGNLWTDDLAPAERYSK